MAKISKKSKSIKKAEPVKTFKGTFLQAKSSKIRTHVLRLWPG